MTRQTEVERRVDELLVEFADFVELGSRSSPFQRTGQMELHVETIHRRRSLGGLAEALEDEAFLQLLYQTLNAWGIGVRASVLRPADEFNAELRAWAEELVALDGTRIDQVDEESVEGIWRLFEGLSIVDNISKIVPVSKNLHHLLPDLVPPIDRAYTGRFLGHHSGFQYDQRLVFDDAFGVFRRISSEIDLDGFVGEGWNTSITKVIDNAIIGYVLKAAPEERPRNQVPSGNPRRVMWSLEDLWADLGQFEEELVAEGLAENSVKTYIGRSETFLRWLAGTYRPRGRRD